MCCIVCSYGNRRYIDERHRHRYEVGHKEISTFPSEAFWQRVTLILLQVNPDMVAQLESAGLSFPGKDDTGRRMEVIAVAE